jgi:heat shock protein HslJ
MKKEYIRFLFLYLAAMMVVLGCGVSGLFGGGSGKTELSGTVWALESFGQEGNLQPTVKDSRITLEFDFNEKMVSGNGGCNHYSAEFEVSGDSLTIGLAMSTLMACFPEEVMNQETAFHQALAQADHFEVMDGKLMVYTADSQVLMCTAE